MSIPPASFIIELQPPSIVIGGGVAPAFANEPFTLRGSVDQNGDLLATSTYPLNLWSGSNNLINLNLYYLAQKAVGQYGIIVYGTSDGNIYQFRAGVGARNPPLGTWTSPTTGTVNVLLDNIPDHRFANVSYSLTLDANNVVTAISNLEGISSNDGILELSVWGAIGISLNFQNVVSASPSNIVLVTMRQIPNNNNALYCLNPGGPCSAPCPPPM